MRTSHGAIFLSVILSAMAHEEFRLLRSRRDAAGTTSAQHHGTEARDVMHVQEGDAASFTCAAASHEPMSVEWRHNGTVVPRQAAHEDGEQPSLRVWHAPLSSESGATLTRSRLRLANVSAQHAGVYACHFSDGLGTLARSKQLVVQPKASATTGDKAGPCESESGCSDKGVLCDGKHSCRCPDGSVPVQGSCSTDSGGPHLASILAWVSSAAAVAVLLAALAVLAARRIRRTSGATLLENVQDDDGLVHVASRRNSFTAMTSHVPSELA